MDAIISLVLRTVGEVWLTFSHNWPFLIVSTLIAVGLKLYLDPKKVSAFLIRHKNAGVVGATAAAVATPLCSCGTTAIVLGMMASMLPWAPIVAFMVASPLTSPEELVYSAGIFGWPFAIAFFTASIFLGLSGGLLASLLEARGWLANQVRYHADGKKITRQPAREDFSRSMTFTSLQLAPAMCCAAEPSHVVETCGCSSTPILAPAPACSCGYLTAKPAATDCSCSEQPAASQSTDCACQPVSAKPAVSGCACTGDSSRQEMTRVTPRLFLEETFITGRRLLFMFLGFAFIGYFLNGLIPSAWVAAIFGHGNVYSIPLAATLGLPLYINTEASLPLVRALLDGGMSQGAALAFLITGAGTSIGAMTGALTIARWRVIGLVIGTLWVGAIAAGYIYNILLGMGLF
jgi:uncharacterized protein